MKIYLAGPMRGIPEFNFPRFHQVAAELRAQGHEVFNPAERDNEAHGADISVGNDTGCEEQAAREHGFNVREALEADCVWICRHAEAIVLLSGWADSNGARAERRLGIAIAAQIIEYDGPWRHLLERPSDIPPA